ncbi:helix-turn-helix transcriptional regulator [Elizabethkingia meningoseptica]
MDIGNEIRKARVKKGLSQEALAFVIGTDQKTISNIEMGKQDLKMNTFINIVKETDFDLIKFFKSKSITFSENSNTVNIFNQIYNKLIEQFELRLKEKDELIIILKEELSKIKKY